jgi:hypothetical protein
MIIISKKGKMEEYIKLKELVESLEKDLLKFLNKGNSSAGTRVTLGMRAVKQQADILRKEVLRIKRETKK